MIRLITIFDYTISDVDSLIATIKKLKFPSKVLKLKELYLNLRHPSEPIINQWSTWLVAVK